MNYIGYFRALETDYLYSVRLIGDINDSDYIEIALGKDPFIVDYNVSNTPFDEIRQSTAIIKIVHNDYLSDIYSPYAHGTQVILYNETTKQNEWVGYLVPRIYDQSYVECMEEIELEAADCVSSLQYFEYEAINNMGIVSLSDIINTICDKSGLLSGYYWTLSKFVDGTPIIPSDLVISEMNFFSSDTEEAWKINEVLGEICKYLGYTAFQWKDRLYFMDYQSLSKNEAVQCSFFAKATNYKQGSPAYMDGPYTISQNDIRGADASISFEPIYNKVVVNDNMYAAEDFIPSLFEDNNLTNRNGEYYASKKIPYHTPLEASYPYGTSFFSQKYVNEKVADDEYIYYCRLYDNKYWESIYGDKNEAKPFTPSEEYLKSPEITKLFFGGTIVDLGVVKPISQNIQQQAIIPNKLDYTRYLCICTKHNNSKSASGEYVGNHSNKPVMKLKDGYKSRVLLNQETSFLVLDYSLIVEKFEERNYINPEWSNTELKPKAGIAGQWHSGVPKIPFHLKIGNKCWNGSKWVDGEANFSLIPQWDEELHNFWNTEISVLNTVHYDEYVNAPGYKIPLNGVDLTQNVEFEILCPPPAQWGNTGNPDFNNYFLQCNSYVWLKDFSLKCVQTGQDAERLENDIIYENVVDEDAVNEMGDIVCKITTYTPMTTPSYSHIALNRNNISFLTEINEPAISTDNRKAEENIISKYVSQYNTPTKKITTTIKKGLAPYQKIYGVDVDNPQMAFVALGSSINYEMNNETITFIQKK